MSKLKQYSLKGNFQILLLLLVFHHIIFLYNLLYKKGEGKKPYFELGRQWENALISWESFILYNGHPVWKLDRYAESQHTQLFSNIKAKS